MSDFEKVLNRAESNAIKVSNLTRKLARQRSSINHLEEQVYDLTNKLNDAEDERAMLEERFEDLTKDYNELAESLNARIAELDALYADLKYEPAPDLPEPVTPSELARRQAAELKAALVVGAERDAEREAVRAAKVESLREQEADLKYNAHHISCG